MDRMKSNGAMVEQIDLTSVPRSAFDLSNHNYLTGKLGAIIPTRVREVYPGDKLEGSVHIVTNFEPLAAPLMANMVQKEETFFIPYNVIWDKSHRFFTGKKGFDENMPSVTLRQLYNTLSTEYGILPTAEEFKRVIVTHEQNPDIYVSELDIQSLDQYNQQYIDKIREYGNYFEVLDILTPLIERMEENFKLIQEIEPEGPDLDDINSSLTQAVIKYYADMLNFFFGPSSQVDYLGAVMHDWKETLTEIFKAHNPSKYGENAQPQEYTPIDYMSQIPINWMPFRAAYWVWYWNYRDQLIETNAFDPEEYMRSSTISESEMFMCLLVRQRCWFKDTFTTALTNTGDGNFVVPVELGQLNNSNEFKAESVQLNDTSLGNGDMGDMSVTEIKVGDVTYQVPSRYLSTSLSDGEDYVGDSFLSLDLFERVKRLASWVSKRLTLGTEYDDVVYSSFMVKLSAQEMVVPELLAAGRTQVAINVVVNNTTTAEQIAGEKTAVAYADNQHDLADVNYFVEQHGLCISFMTIMPIPSYPNGINRLYLRQNRFDYYWPEFAQLGFDAVYNAELTGLVPRGGQSPFNNDRNALAVFGYQGRYYDLKSSQDEQHGRMLTDLNYLTFGRNFGFYDVDLYEEAKLNYIFVHCWPRLDMFVVEDRFEDLFRSDVSFRYGWERPVPVPSKILK